MNTDDKYRGDSAGHGRQIVAATCPSGSPRGVLFAKNTTINSASTITNKTRVRKTPSVHYRLRAIRGGPLGVVNFTSHFIVIQIFQILFLPPVSFYSHPNISDRFVGDEINLFNLTFHDITIY